MYTDILYSASDRQIDRKKLFSELTKIEKLLLEIKDGSLTPITAGTKIKTLKNKKMNNGITKSNGITKRKTNKITDRKKLFIRRPKIKRFKNPFYLSIKNKKK